MSDGILYAYYQIISVNTMMPNDDKRAEYYQKLKFLFQKGCIIFSPKETKGVWEIGTRGLSGNYRCLSSNENLRVAIDLAYEKITTRSRMWRNMTNDGGRVIIWIILLGGFIYGMASFFLSVFARLPH